MANWRCSCRGILFTSLQLESWRFCFIRPSDTWETQCHWWKLDLEPKEKPISNVVEDIFPVSKRCYRCFNRKDGEKLKNDCALCRSCICRFSARIDLIFLTLISISTTAPNLIWSMKTTGCETAISPKPMEANSQNKRELKWDCREENRLAGCISFDHNCT